MSTKGELIAAEDAAWAEVRAVITALVSPQLEEPGYYPEGWSVRDMIAHIGSWQAEAQCVMEQIRMGTYEDRDVDVNGLNRRFFESNRDLPLSVVQAEAWAARTRMQTELNLLPELTPTAESWFVESGVEHYAEHLPRLREWAAELRAR
jgi:hypothetical protein